LLGNGIFNVDGLNWKNQRQIASKLFTQSNFNSFICEVFIKHSSKVAEILGNFEEIEIQNIFQRFTLDSIGIIAFGKSFESLEDNGTKEASFATAFDSLQYKLLRDLVDPFLKLKRMLNIDRSTQE